MPALPPASIIPVLSPTSVDDLIRSAVDLARTGLGMDVGFVTEFKNGLRIFRHVASVEGFTPIRAGDFDPLDQSYCQHIASGALPAAVADSLAHPELAALAATAVMQIRAHVGVPIRFSDGKVFGTFCCYSRLPHADIASCNIATMTHFAWLIGQLLETRVQAERTRELLVDRLQGVIAERKLTVVYQPVWDVARQQLVGYEALARFAAEPAQTPDIWFGEAHAVELGDSMEIMAIQKALEGLPLIPDGAYLAINVSPHAIISGALEQALAGAPLERLVLEVTEHSSISDYSIISQALTCLRAGGLRLAVDDAGSGYASFRHILKLKPEVIKLDQSLIRHIDHDPGCHALAVALIAFAHETGSSVVAEGVETEEEMSTLRQLGVDTAQGYLLGRPDALPAR